MSTVPFRNRDGKLVDVPVVTASRLKSGRFDNLLAAMQTAKAKAGVAAAFDATPKELGPLR